MTLVLQIEQVLGGATESFNIQYIQSIPGKSSNLTTLLVNAPGLVSQPISYTLVNTRPFDVPVASAVEFVGLIYLLILSVRLCTIVALVLRTHLGCTVYCDHDTLRCTYRRYTS